MKVFVPDYYYKFKCTAEKCQHTCCKGWEVEIDENSLERFTNEPEIKKFIEYEDGAHFKLDVDERCPFLLENGLCKMILTYGEDMLCQICTDHPRFRNYWTDRVEMGLGIVCEEAARIILTNDSPMKIVEYFGVDKYNDNDMHIDNTSLPEDEQWLMEFRENLYTNIPESGPIARLREYMIYRHIADALYDDRLEERVSFINQSIDNITKKWHDSDGSIDSLIKIVIDFSYNVEYDEEEKEKYLSCNGNTSEKPFMCPCCGKFVFIDGPGSYEICPICSWEDDIVQFKDPDYPGGANKLSLNDYKKDWEGKRNE